MTLYIRVLFILLTMKFRPRCHVFDTYDVPFRVWPTDLDFFLHMNNAKYFSVMDLARGLFLVRSGLWGSIAKEKWFGVVAGQWIDFHRSLELFDKFAVRNKIVGWDDKFVYTSQDFVRGGEVVATAIVCLRFLKKGGGGVVPADVMKALGEPHVSPELAPEIISWRQRRG